MVSPAATGVVILSLWIKKLEEKPKTAAHSKSGQLLDFATLSSASMPTGCLSIKMSSPEEPAFLSSAATLRRPTGLLLSDQKAELSGPLEQPGSAPSSPSFLR